MHMPQICLQVRRLRPGPGRVSISRVLLIAIILSGLLVTQRMDATPPASVNLSTYVRVGRFDPARTDADHPACQQFARPGSLGGYL